MKLRPYQQKAIKECWRALKKNDEPVLLMASVGAGKSLMLASILLTMQEAGKNSLCIVNNAELVRNNCETLINQGGKASIYCAALKKKDTKHSIIFGTPQSIINGINKNEPIANIKFNIIIVDEAHCINFLNGRSAFIRIFRHYKSLYPDMRLLGATGTNFRFKGSAIVGEKCLFKTQVGNITTEQLINDGYLIKPEFEVDPNLIIDFSTVKIKQNGLFDQRQLEAIIEKSARLTELICKQLIHIMESQSRYGVFIFATTKKHAYEILSHLPKTQSALILGETPQQERTEILDKARKGEIRYLVNIAIISVGVDVPAFDTIAYLRPTESLVLLVQTMGRVLRLSTDTNKTEALVLDFAGNIERHRDWDNPIIKAAVQATINKDKPLVIVCPCCNELNTEHSRRCIGASNNKRCDYYFEFKECPNEKCKTKNDIASRHCRICETEIIDPNKKLALEKITDNSSLEEIEVLFARFSIFNTQSFFRVNCAYKCQDKQGRRSVYYESYTPISPKAKNVFYGKFVRLHCPNPHDWYLHLDNRNKVKNMLTTALVPSKLILKREGSNYTIKKKIF